MTRTHASTPSSAGAGKSAPVKKSAPAASASSSHARTHKERISAASSSCKKSVEVARRLATSPEAAFGAHALPHACILTEHLARQTSPSPTLLKLEDFYSYSPQKLELDERIHIPSPQTRRPATFDTHLAKELRLKRMVYAPRLEDDLHDLAAQAAIAAHLSGSLPAISDDTADPRWNKEAREGILHDRRNTTMIDESSVVDYYQSSAGTWVPAIAATLEYRSESWDAGPLQWRTETRDAEAKADGFLKFISNENDLHRDSRRLNNVALVHWEFKSVKAGSIGVMNAIMELVTRENFDWVTCKDGEEDCPRSHPPDADQPQKVDYLVTSSTVGPDVRKKDCICPTIAKGRTEEWTPPSNIEISKGDRQKAIWIVEQVWSQAVKNDTTFVVIHVGSWEIIGFRDREHGILYVTRIIPVWKTAYGELQVGLYLAGIRDTRKRHSMMRKAAKLAASNLGSAGHDEEATGPSKDEVQKQILDDALKCNELVVGISRTRAKLGKVSLPFHTWTPYIRVPDCFERSEGQPDRIRITVTSSLGESVVKGTMKIEKRKFEGLAQFDKEVVLKAAQTPTAMENLFDEYDTYESLSEEGKISRGIPRIIGLFSNSESASESELYESVILLMENVGESIATISDQDRAFFRSRGQNFKTVLDRVHQAGFVKGLLNSKHLLVHRKTARCSIISFGRARRESQSSKRMKEEKSILQRLISNYLPDAALKSNYKLRPRKSRNYTKEWLKRRLA